MKIKFSCYEEREKAFYEMEKMVAGYNTRILIGCRFNPLLSAKLSVKWGKIALLAQKWKYEEKLLSPCPQKQKLFKYYK